MKQIENYLNKLEEFDNKIELQKDALIIAQNLLKHFPKFDKEAEKDRKFHTRRINSLMEEKYQFEMRNRHLKNEYPEEFI